MPIGMRLGLVGQTGRGLPSGKAALGGYGFGGVTWVRLGLVWAPYLALSLPSAAAVAVTGEEPRAHVGPVPRAGGVPGAVAWLAGAAATAACKSGAPPGGEGAAGAAAWAAGAASPAGTWSGAGGLGSMGAAWGYSAGGLTGTAASASCRSSRCAGVSPVNSGETREQERDRRWWQLSRLGEPSE